MVDIASKTPSFKHGSTTVGLRKRRQLGMTKPEVVRVVATDEKYRKALKHGVTGKRFMPDIGQSVEWPNDTYTHRRLKEGSVKLEESPQQKRQGEGERQEVQSQGRRQTDEQAIDTEPTKPAPAASRG